MRTLLNLHPTFADDRTKIDVRTIRSTSATELYITAVPAQNELNAIGRMYADIARLLRDNEALIVQERLFAVPYAHSAVLGERASVMGDLADAVLPTMLNVIETDTQVLGVQIHAIKGINPPKVLYQDGTATGRSFESNGCGYVTASGLAAPRFTARPAQARHVFEQAEQLVEQAGGSIKDVARTWIWMDNILDWYGQLNQVRNGFFSERGLLNGPGLLPASTGIGISPARGSLALDLFAAWGQTDVVRRYHAVGNQRSAHEYGSAFARASCMATPGGTTVFCSGTAAIDSAGNTCHIDDISGQVSMTVENVLAVFGDMKCPCENVVQAMAYCATPQVREWFIMQYASRLPWPCLSMLADVCRPDLLFEIEVTAGLDRN